VFLAQRRQDEEQHDRDQDEWQEALKVHGIKRP
jgi:hypothetical protein